MKAIQNICLSLLLLMVANPAVAQIYVSSEFLRSAERVVKVRIIEEKNDAPIPYASVYLTAKNDTLITNFTLTDTTGLATIKKRPVVFTVATGIRINPGK